MFQKWFTRGVSCRQIFPTICDHICSVSRVSRHESSGRAGHAIRALWHRRTSADRDGNLDAEEYGSASRRYWIDTASNEQVADAPVVWLVTARPTSTVWGIAMVSVPTSVQFTPSADS